VCGILLVCMGVCVYVVCVYVYVSLLFVCFLCLCNSYVTVGVYAVFVCLCVMGVCAY